MKDKTRDVYNVHPKKTMVWEKNKTSVSAKDNCCLYI